MLNQGEENHEVTTLIFDVDDTLYDVSTGFSDHRHVEAKQRFMVEYLDFPKLRDTYFDRYQATAKAPAIAGQEGRFSPPMDPSIAKSPLFDMHDLSEFWATSLNFALLGGRKERLLQDLKDCKLKLVAFSSSPRKYVKRVLQELGLFDLFGEDRFFALDDLLPSCKPEKEAFEKLLQKIGVTAKECVIIEDNMKNIRQAKALNMKTVLVTGKNRMRKNRDKVTSFTVAETAEATKSGHVHGEDDSAVDIAIETIEELRTVLGGLWDSPAVFAPILN